MCNFKRIHLVLRVLVVASPELQLIKYLPSNCDELFIFPVWYLLLFTLHSMIHMKNSIVNKSTDSDSTQS